MGCYGLNYMGVLQRMSNGYDSFSTLFVCSARSVNTIFVYISFTLDDNIVFQPFYKWNMPDWFHIGYLCCSMTFEVDTLDIVFTCDDLICWLVCDREIVDGQSSQAFCCYI